MTPYTTIDARLEDDEGSVRQRPPAGRSAAKPIDTLQMMASYKGGNIHHSHPLDGTKEDVDPKHIEIMQLADPQNESARRRAEIQAIAPDSQNYR